jgi:hypothetical protein
MASNAPEAGAFSSFPKMTIETSTKAAPRTTAVRAPRYIQTKIEEILNMTAATDQATDLAAVKPGDNAPRRGAEKASGQLLKLVVEVIDTGVGPLTGSIPWAEDRLSRVQGDRHKFNAEPTREAGPEE